MSFVNTGLTSTLCFIVTTMLSILLDAGAVKFTSTYQGRNLTGLVGSSVNFTWSFSGDVDAIIWGLKTSGVGSIEVAILALDKAGITGSHPNYKDRVNGSRSGGSSSGQVTFTMTSVTEGDENIYGCKITAANQFDPQAEAFTFVQLVLEGPPNITHISGNQTVNEGDNLVLNCTAVANPTPTITWRRLSDSRVVTMPLTGINRQEGGGYRCTADNGIGNPTTADVFITVQYKPSGITISTSAAQNTAIQGQNVILSCHVTEAKPAVSRYGFYRNDSLLASTTNVNKFIIRSLKRSQHFGEYKCEAHNDAGDGQSHPVVLNINVPAEIQSSAGNLTVNEGSSIELRCDATGYPAPTITWKKDGQQKNSVKGVLRIASSKKSDSGAYVCIADNGVRRVEKETFVIVHYRPFITAHAISAAKSWIGQTVQLTCEADGLPTPTITWKKPNRNTVKEVTAKRNEADVEMKTDGDFGSYTCEAINTVGAAATRTVEIKQIKAPGPPNIVLDDRNIQAQSLMVKWTAPSDDGGSPITAYRVVILTSTSGQVVRNENITEVNAAKHLSFGGLNISTNYTVRVYARNAVFEGDPGEKLIRTKFQGVPAAPEILRLPEETNNTQITLKWSEPADNGKPIKRFTVYQRTVKEDGTPREWIQISVIPAISNRQVNVTLEKGKVYEFVVTATNEFGESLKEEEKIKKITVGGGVPSAVELKAEQNDEKITLTWEKPDGNGAAITKYSVYHRVANAKEWEDPIEIPAGSKLEYVFEGEKGKEYEFVVTASNRYGESPKADIKSFKVSAVSGTTKPLETQAGSPCGSLHAAYVTVIVVLVIIIVLLSVMVWRLRRHLGDKCRRCENLIAMEPLANQTTDNTKLSTVEQANDTQTYATPIGGDYMPLHASTRSWEIMREQVDIIKVIGQGAFSQVVKATVKNVRGYQEYITVAVKMLKANAPASDRKDLLSELELMKKLKPHPHVIKLIGCVTESDPLLVLIEYVPFGDLLGYLRKSRGLNDTYYKDPDVRPQTSLTAEQLMRFAWQVADGMCYLSSRKIIHRDLAARNVLVGEGEKCKVTDFGMARNVQQDDIYNKKSRGRLPVKWTAYEALLYGRYTTQSDVWSYGILLYEILTIGGSPYPTINVREIAAKLQEGYRMTKPRHVDEKLYQIMLRCWEENPNDRPTFEKLGRNMKDMERNHKTYVNLKQYDDGLYANVHDLADE